MRDCAEPINMPILKIPIKHYLGIVSQSQQEDFKKRFRKRAEETDAARNATGVRRYLKQLITHFFFFCCESQNETYPSIKMYIVVIKIIIIKLTLTMTFVVFYRNPFETTEGFIEKYNQAQGCKEQEQYENLVKQFLSRCKVLG